MTAVPASAFVTGGSGFIGGKLVRRLVVAGARVRALARSDRSAAAVEELGAEAVRGDLEDVDAMARGAEGQEVAFHLAAHLGAFGERGEFERINVRGTQNVLVACRRAGLRRFVHCSTEAALLAGEPLVDVDESAPRRPDSKALYSATKARAEELVERSNGEDMAAVIVRPRFVWGAGDTTLLPQLIETVRAGRFRWINGGAHRTSTTHVDNTVEGLLLGAERGGAGETYFVTDGEPVVFREFVTALMATQGVEPPDSSVPGWLAGPLATAGEAAWHVLPLKGEPPLTRLAYWLTAQECTIDISKARSQLGYEPVTSVPDGLRELGGEAGG